MYLLKLVIVPTGSLLFRRIPFATTVFPTYPFAPPTALAGFLRRLVMLANGLEIPGDIRGRAKHALNEDAQFYTLPPDYICLGAYPSAYTMHRTKRHQPWGATASFKHVEFSALRREDSEFNAQIPIWEYLHTEQMVGYVIHNEREPLEKLRLVENWGCKFGKEGFAFVESASEVLDLRGPQRMKARPATPVPADALDGEPADFFTLYTYSWKTLLRPAPESAEGVPGNGILIQPFLAAWVRREVELEYYTDGQEYFPKAWIDKLANGGA